MAIIQNTLKFFLKNLDKTTSRGQQVDSLKAGCENTTTNTNNTLNYNLNKNNMKTYQWIKGEKAGSIVKSDGSKMQEDNTEFLIFEDGTRCNTMLIGDYLFEINSEKEEDWIMLNDVAPTPVNKIEPTITTVIPDNTISVEEMKNVYTEVKRSPIYNLLESAKKQQKTIDIKIKIDVPQVDLINVILASFDNGEEEIKHYLDESIFNATQFDIISKQILDSIYKDFFIKKEKNERSKTTVST